MLTNRFLRELQQPSDISHNPRQKSFPSLLVAPPPSGGVPLMLDEKYRPNSCFPAQTSGLSASAANALTNVTMPSGSKLYVSLTAPLPKMCVVSIASFFFPLFKKPHRFASLSDARKISLALS